MNLREPDQEWPLLPAHHTRLHSPAKQPSNVPASSSEMAHHSAATPNCTLVCEHIKYPSSTPQRACVTAVAGFGVMPDFFCFVLLLLKTQSIPLHTCASRGGPVRVCSKRRDPGRLNPETLQRQGQRCLILRTLNRCLAAVAHAQLLPFVWPLFFSVPSSRVHSTAMLSPVQSAARRHPWTRAACVSSVQHGRMSLPVSRARMHTMRRYM